MIPTQAIAQPVGPIQGLGLFSGKPASMTVGPGTGSGITFKSGGAMANADVRHVTYDTSWAGLPKGVPIRNTTLTCHRLGPQSSSENQDRTRAKSVPDIPNGPIVATIEHILGTLAGLGIWDATITIDGPEIPILDGSAKGFVDLLRPVLRPAPLTIKPLVLERPVEVRDGVASILATPSSNPAEFSYTYNLDYGEASPLKPQGASWRGSTSEFAALIAPARTFSLAAEARAAQQMGLFKHLTPRDMLVIGDSGEPIDNTWRMDNEPARHKLLDLIGDLALLQRPLIANVIATRSGHRLTHEFCRAVLAQASR
jgi:UDP-3-O-acyl-N-acetylglucosamine deacetylase